MRVFSRKHAGTFLAVTLILGQASPALAMQLPDMPNANASDVPGEIIVQFKKNAVNLGSADGVAAAAKIAHTDGLIASDTVRSQNLALFIARDVSETDQLIEELRANPAVESVEPNILRKVQAFPGNDPRGSELWGLDNTGQTVNGTAGTADADIDAPEAWAINEGTHAQVIVAVIDSGVDYLHEDLVNQMWDGTNCKDENGSALGGCIHGYDFLDDDKDPLPLFRGKSNMHGTHVAGTIAAEKNNGKGVAGIAGRAKIMALRAGDDSFGLPLFATLASIDFARQNGAKVINASYGGGPFSQLEFNAIKQFTDAGGIFVAAAGNGGFDGIGDNNDSVKFYPASYDIANLISVAATTQTDTLTSFSNFGAATVDVGAPGKNIVSTSFLDGSAHTFSEENFDTTALGSVPLGWIKTGSMGVADTDFFPTRALAGDAAIVYQFNGGGTATTVPVNALPGSGIKALAFNTACDTQYSSQLYTDFMRVEANINGSFFFLAQFDEFDLDDDGNQHNDPPVRSLVFPLPVGAVSSATQVRFRWFTNGDADVGTLGKGCVIDDLRIIEIGLDDHYEFLNGTSMAAPHVSGLAALILGYKPGLTSTDVNNIILNTGDKLVSLQGKALTERRINAFNALRQADQQGPVITLTGAGELTIPQGSVYTDLGATAQDDVDGDITAAIVVTNPVDTATLGDYVVRYNVNDAAGNAATQVTRSVHVTAVVSSSSSSTSSSQSSSSLSSSASSVSSESSSSSSESSVESSSSSSSTSSSESSVSSESSSATSSSESSASSASSSVASSESSSSSSSGESSVSSSSASSDVPSSSSSSSSSSSDMPASSSSSSSSSVEQQPETLPVPTSTNRAPAIDTTSGIGNGSHRGNGLQQAFSGIAMMQKLHEPESVYDADHPTERQKKFLCAVQRMMSDTASLSFLDQIAGEIEHLTGIPRAGADAFLADDHACDTVNLARQGVSRVVATVNMGTVTVDAGGYPVSSNPTWNACVRGNVFNPQIIRQNPERDPVTGRPYSCDHYSNATNEWYHPDLRITFTLVPGKDGRGPALTLPRGYIAVNPSAVVAAAPSAPDTPALPASSSEAQKQPVKKDEQNGSASVESLSDSLIGAEERRMRRGTLFIDGKEVQNTRPVVR